MKEYNSLKRIIQEKNLQPNPNVVGEFIKGEQGKGEKGFLSPNNWIFHPQIVDCVLKGDYDNIMPYSAEFVTTQNCSNRCENCAYKDVKELEGVWIKNNFSDPDAHMQNIGFAKSLLDKLVSGGIKGLIFTGGGEPFLFKGLENLIAYATEKNVDSVVYTNGNAIPNGTIKKLIDSSPLLIRVSLNAGTKKVYNKFHNPLNPKNAFERTLETITLLAKNSKNSKTDIGVGVVINKANRYDLVNTALRIKEIINKAEGGIDFITYRPEFNYYGAEQLPRKLLNETYNIVENDVRKILEGTRVKVSNITCRFEALLRDTRNYDICRSTGLYVELSPDGKLQLCCDRNMNRKYTLGDLKRESLKNIHLGDERKRILNQINLNKCEYCPPACKSHEINKQFHQIENLREKGKMFKVKLWIEEQQKQPPPKMVNF